MDGRAQVCLVAGFVTGICLTLAAVHSRGAVGPSDQEIKGLTTEDGSNAHVSLRPSRDTGIQEGIEGCIGNTPLIKIKSLSEATGCEIFAKAEVCSFLILYAAYVQTGTEAPIVP